MHPMDHLPRQALPYWRQALSQDSTPAAVLHFDAHSDLALPSLGDVWGVRFSTPHLEWLKRRTMMLETIVEAQKRVLWVKHIYTPVITINRLYRLPFLIMGSFFFFVLTMLVEATELRISLDITVVLI